MEGQAQKPLCEVEELNEGHHVSAAINTMELHHYHASLAEKYKLYCK